MEQRPPNGEFAVASAGRPELVDRVGRALAAPPSPGRHQWAEGVHGALVELRAELRAPDGVDGRGETLSVAVMGAAPRLATAVGRLVQERLRIVEMVDRLLRDLSATDRTDDVRMIRDCGTALLRQVQRHSQHASDLLHDAHREVGGES